MKLGKSDMKKIQEYGTSDGNNMQQLEYKKLGESEYGILNTFLFLFANEMLAIKAGIHKMLVRITVNTLIRLCL